MKKLILLLLLPFTIKAQLQIKSENDKPKNLGTVKIVNDFWSSIDYFVSGDDTLYALCFKNREYSHITDIKCVKFSGKNNTLSDLYKVMKSFFTDENKKKKDYSVDIKLGESDLHMFKTKSFGVTSLQFYTGTANTYFDEKMIDKMFGKK